MSVLCTRDREESYRRNHHVTQNNKPSKGFIRDMKGSTSQWTQLPKKTV